MVVSYCAKPLAALRLSCGAKKKDHPRDQTIRRHLSGCLARTVKYRTTDQVQAAILSVADLMGKANNSSVDPDGDWAGEGLKSTSS